MIRSSVISVFVIVAACAAMRPVPAEPGITEVKTKHVQGAPYSAWPELEEKR